VLRLKLANLAAETGISSTTALMIRAAALIQRTNNAAFVTEKALLRAAFHRPNGAKRTLCRDEKQPREAL
jgi:hypothetical protein